MIITIVPAQPGWALLHPEMYRGNSDEFDASLLEEIVAWRIESEEVAGGSGRRLDQAYAITPDGTGSQDAFVVSPNGSVTDRVEHYFRDAAAAIAHIRSGAYLP